jgi:alpha-beta hydrolase superfamily lysophospholipase
LTRSCEQRVKKRYAITAAKCLLPRTGTGEEMITADGIKELQEMAAKLAATAHKLPPGRGRHELLQDIERFRAQLSGQLSAINTGK